ncbi:MULTISPECIES: carboxyl-terminal processing protease CtpB [unclassified Okeania]|uniref:carboxyl-terminal processing protease CtpB n=1 Tax=unclassified Okeania TaxID=2634635 RepID=UPI0013B632EF|nr:MULTISPECIES: carboxyl-terminal processing protease CtpB [unclassified Okeania]NES78635.1 PDZ domain-containing protein [Okeania sp. SIO1H4]NET22124.1 PDZ domain-containing protein [Okeania sp. SIO1H5]NET95481.1 PDZ domain-containing protein [Okeania sp. SIO1H2]
MNSASKRNSILQAILYSGAIATTTALSLLAPTLSKPAEANLENSPKAVLDEAWQIVNRDYVDGSFNQTDWQATRQTLLEKNYTSSEQAYEALRQALDQLNDPYTRFLDPQQFKTLTNQTSGEMSGVGMQLKEDELTKVITVVNVVENSPAMKAGLLPGDQILEIDGKPTASLSVSAAAKLIRGDVGTDVVLQVMRSGETEFDVTLTRARIELQAVRYELKREGNKRIGYIHLQEFSAHAGEQMQKAIENLDNQNADGYVLDLRGNPGGLLRISIDIARMLMDQGAIVSTVNRNGEKQELRANRSALTDKPIVVLVDGDSASASEILAGALKDNGRAVIMGDQTFGKALVQSVHSLSDGSGLAVTIAHYYTPKGTDISKKGVTPDVSINLTDSQKRRLYRQPGVLATISDPYYFRAVNLLKNKILGSGA